MMSGIVSKFSLEKFNRYVTLLGGGGGDGRRVGYELYYYVTVIKKWLTRLYNIENWRNWMFLFTNLSNAFYKNTSGLLLLNYLCSFTTT